HRSLKAKEVAVHLTRAVHLQGDPSQAGELGWIGPEHHDIDDFFVRLRLDPGQQVLAEEEHEKKQQAEGIEHPKQLTAEDLTQGDARDGKNGPKGTSKFACPTAIVQQTWPHSQLRLLVPVAFTDYPMKQL